MDIFILILLLILALMIAIHFYIKLRYQRLTKRYLTKFNRIPNLATYEEAMPTFFLGENYQKFDHAVLLLHGYSSAPNAFKYLTRELEKENIPFYCPLLTGFGLSNMKLLSHIQSADWFRDAIHAYDLLAKVAKRVSIVGQSNGASLAVYIAQERSVEHLILSGPNLAVSHSDKRYKKLIRTPVISQILFWLLPVIKKPKRKDRVTNVDTLDPETALNAFHYPALPILSVKAVWDIQDTITIEKATMKHLSIIYGEHDESVNIDQLSQTLKLHNIQYTMRSFPNSAHNVLKDFDRNEACQEVVRILKS